MRIQLSRAGRTARRLLLLFVVFASCILKTVQLHYDVVVLILVGDIVHQIALGLACTTVEQVPRTLQVYFNQLAVATILNIFIA